MLQFINLLKRTNMRENILYQRSVTFRDKENIRWTVNFEICDKKGQMKDFQTLEEYEEKVYVTMSGEGAGSLGQCDGHISPRTDTQRQLLKFWRRYHMNGMTAGTQKQKGYLASRQYSDDFQKFVDTFHDSNREGCSEHVWSLQLHYKKITGEECRVAKTIVDKYMNGRMFEYIFGNPESTVFKPHGKDDFYVESFFLSINGLYDDRGYRYGHGWLHTPIPDDIQSLYDGICDAIEDEERELTEELGAKFNMGANDFRATDEKVNQVMEWRGCDEEEAKHFIALGMFLGCTFGDLDYDFREEGYGKQLYSAFGSQYHVGTDEELEDIATEIVHNDSEYKHFWRESVQAGGTEMGLNDWLDSVIRDDGWCSVLNHYDGKYSEYTVAGESICVCRN
jgi:hypothetical protein